MRRSGFSLVEVMVGVVLATITGFAVVKVVMNSSETSRTASEQVKQNAMLRNASSLIRRDLSNADQLITLANNAGAGAAPYGSDVVFTRSKESGGVTTYYAERIAYRSPSDSVTGVRNTITVQIKSSTGSYPDTAAWSEAAAPSKVVLDQVSQICVSTSCVGSKPLFVYQKDAVTPADASVANWQDDVGVMDFSLTRDADGNGVKYSPQTLDSTIYLQNLGKHTQGAPGGGVVC